MYANKRNNCRNHKTNKKEKMRLTYFLIILVILILIVVPTSLSYKMEPDESATHQKITKEAIEVWPLIPNEIKNHSGNSIDTTLDILANFDSGDDIITGSGEEDRAIGAYVHYYGNHFWDSDDPNTASMLGNDDYNDGLGIMGSSYRRALNLWNTEVIPSYLKGNIDRSYYYLGRVAHLLEDATQPGHALNDAHPPGLDPSFLEDYAGNPAVYNTYDGMIHRGQQYNYENLISNFNWNLVQPTRTPDKNYLDFFRLFWYSAQKTQYWASDDIDGNTYYTLLNGSTPSWSCSGTSSTNLWANEGYTSCSQFISDNINLNSTSVAVEANATIPHAMKAVAGLYRLFWDQANSYHWPTFHHNYQRTGFTMLRGDTNPANPKKIDFTIDSTLPGAVDHPSIGDLDGNGKQEVVITTSKYTLPYNGTVYSLEKSGTNSFKYKWNTKIGMPITKAPTLANVDGDTQKEVIFGGNVL